MNPSQIQTPPSQPMQALLSLVRTDRAPDGGRCAICKVPAHHWLRKTSTSGLVVAALTCHHHEAEVDRQLAEMTIEKVVALVPPAKRLERAAVARRTAERLRVRARRQGERVHQTTHAQAEARALSLQWHAEAAAQTELARSLSVASILLWNPAATFQGHPDGACEVSVGEAEGRWYVRLFQEGKPDQDTGPYESEFQARRSAIAMLQSAKGT